MRAPYVALALAAAAAVTVALLLPPPAIELPDTSVIAEPVRGAIHVHTRRSDGSGTVAQVAAAAARAGLRFVILTDHGDAARPPDPPSYVYGVLCIDAVEISADDGHVLALGLPGRAPYRLGGEARDVVADIARLGGMSVAAHPDSPKASLRLRDWNVPFDGLEWLNADSEWRDERPATLARALLTYPFRTSVTLTTLLDRPAGLLRRWDDLTTERPVVSLVAADAHASVGIGRWSNPYGDRSLLALPGYEQLFRTFSVALPGVQLTGDADSDAKTVLSAIRSGHLYSAIDALASPARLLFTATSGGTTIYPGAQLTASDRILFRVETTAPREARTHLLKNGVVVASAEGGRLEFAAPPEAGAYRVEVYLPRGPGDPRVPWLLSNPIYAGPFTAREAPPPAALRHAAVQYADGAPGPEWAVENSPSAEGVLDVVPAIGGTQLSWRFALAGSTGESPYVALTMRTPGGLAAYDRLMFAARASRPMRLWVQLRARSDREGLPYWRRSVYLDDMPRDLVVAFDDMRPAGRTDRERPPLDLAEALLFVIDQVHTPLGTGGQVWIDDVRYGR
jgi:hypothetical protein